LGQLEKDLLIRLVGCIDPKSPAISGLYGRASRSLGLDPGELPKSERAIREKLRARLRSEFRHRSKIPEHLRAIPGLNSAEGEWKVPIPYAALSIMAEKIARGCEYRYRGRRRLVRAPYGIRTLIRKNDFIPEPFASGCVSLDFGPGCQIRRLRFFEDSQTVWYFITIWASLNLHVRIEVESELLKAEKGFGRPEGLMLPESSAMQVSNYLRMLNQEAPEKDRGE
jgi:hypothetical protein